MSDPSARTFTADFRRFFVRGLAVLLPTVLTLWIVVAAYHFVDSRIAEPINRGVRVTMNNAARFWSPLQRFDPAESQLRAEIAERAVARGVVSREEVRRRLAAELERNSTDDELQAAIAQRATTVERGRISREAVRTEMRQREIDEWWADRWYLNLIGLIIAIVGVYTAGRLLGGYFGRQIYRRLETLITSLPIFKQVYPYVKQVVDFIFSDETQQMRFSRVVATEYPRKGIWSVGFQTGPPLSTIAAKAGDSVTIFIPSSPTPFTGYTITVPRKDVIELPITVEEAIRFAVSAGVLVPDHQVLQEAKARGAAAEAAELERTQKVLTQAGASPSKEAGPAGRSHGKAAKPKPGSVPG